MCLSSWTSKLILLPLCFLVVGVWTYLISLCSFIYSIWKTNTAHGENSTLFHTTTDHDLNLTVVSVSLSWELFMSLSGVIYMAAQVKGSLASSPQVLYAFFYALVSTVSFLLNGDVFVGRIRDIFSEFYPTSPDGVVVITPSNEIAPPYDKITLAMMIGSLVKGLSWLFFIVMHFFQAYRSKAATPNNNQNITTTLATSTLLFVTLVYCTVVTWSVFGSKVEVNFAFPTYIILFDFLVAILLVKCFGYSDSIMMGVFLSILSVYLTYMVEILIDLVRTIDNCYYSSSQWSLHCIHMNPIYYSTMISIGMAGTLLWMYIFELWQFSYSQPSLKEAKLHKEAKEETPQHSDTSVIKNTIYIV